ncbi:MAG: DUF3368 domain-containing protein [Verrucomicrobiota bacterium]
MPAVVVDTSVLITLAAGEQFNLLRDFYGHIYIPPAVWDEVSASSRPFGLPEVRRARDENWLSLRQPVSLEAIRGLPFNLQQGESEALALALALPNALLLVDDAQGRRAAHALGLHYTGTLGVLLRAKTETRIPELRPVLERLRQRTTFWLSDTLYETVLRSVGETP